MKSTLGTSLHVLGFSFFLFFFFAEGWKERKTGREIRESKMDIEKESVYVRARLKVVEYPHVMAYNMCNAL